MDLASRVAIRHIEEYCLHGSIDRPIWQCKLCSRSDNAQGQTMLKVRQRVMLKVRQRVTLDRLGCTTTSDEMPEMATRVPLSYASFHHLPRQFVRDDSFSSTASNSKHGWFDQVSCIAHVHQVLYMPLCVQDDKTYKCGTPTYWPDKFRAD